MSADNYAVVKKKKDGWYWGMFSDSLDRGTPNKELPDDEFDHGPFETDEEAENNAFDSCFLEYGVEVIDD